MAERSLVIFTLLAQASAGVIVLLGGLGVAAGLTGMVPVGAGDLPGLPAVIVVGAMLGAGILASLLHLGNPRNAVRAASGWRTSWLSREILAAGVFGGLVALAGAVELGALALPGIVTPAMAGVLRAPLTGLAVLAGLGLVAAMTGLYAVPTVPSWDPAAVAGTFTGASLLLGAPVAGLLATAAGWMGPLAAGWFGLAVVAGAILEAWSAVRLRRVTGVARLAGGLRPRPVATLPAGPDPAGLAGGLLLAALGLAGLALGLGPIAAVLLVGAIAALAAEAAISRARFYQRAPGTHA